MYKEKNERKKTTKSTSSWVGLASFRACVAFRWLRRLGLTYCHKNDHLELFLNAIELMRVESNLLALVEL